MGTVKSTGDSPVTSVTVVLCVPVKKLKRAVSSAQPRMSVCILKSEEAPLGTGSKVGGQLRPHLGSDFGGAELTAPRRPCDMAHSGCPCHPSGVGSPGPPCASCQSPSMLASDAPFTRALTLSQLGPESRGSPGRRPLLPSEILQGWGPFKESIAPASVLALSNVARHEFSVLELRTLIPGC